MLPGVILTLLKFALLLALYIFLARALRTVAADLYGPKRRTASTPRPAVATPTKTPRKSRKVPREIVVHGPSGPPVVRPLGKTPLVLGRAAGVDIVLEDVYSSDEHVEIGPGDGGFTVRDLGSTNGTFLNGAKLTRPTALAAGDQLRLGKTRVEVRR